MIKLKVTLSIVLVFISLSVARAQSYIDSVKTDFTAYNQLIIDKQLEKALDYTNPDFFKVIPRDQMLVLLNRLYKSIDFDMKLTLPDMTGFEPMKKINGIDYIRFQSQSTLQMKFEKETAQESDEDKKLNRSLVKAGLIKQFGLDNVTYNETTAYYTIKSKQPVVASKHPTTGKWTFVVVRPGQEKLLAAVLPAELIK